LTPPAEPDAEGAILEVSWRLNAGRGKTRQFETRALERLRDIDERRALFACGQRIRQPVNDNIGAAAGDDLYRRDVRAAGLDRHVEVLVLVIALVLGDVVTGELGLRHPFELQRHLVGGLRGARRDKRGRRHQSENQLPHRLFSLSKVLTQVSGDRMHART
jgi:hypothetical protein